MEDQPLAVSSPPTVSEENSEDDLEVATAFAKGLGSRQACPGSRSLPGTANNSRASTGQSFGIWMQTTPCVTPRRPSTVITNLSRGNTATVTPAHLEDVTMHMLAAQGELVDFKILLEDHDVDEEDDVGMTSLMWACLYNQLDTASYLLKLGAACNHSNHEQATPLMLACLRGNVEVARVLMQSGAGIDSADKQGNTALMYAAYAKHAESVGVLLQRGADLTAANHSGLTAMDIAVQHRHKQVQRTIERHMLSLLEPS